MPSASSGWGGSLSGSGWAISGRRTSEVVMPISGAVAIELWRYPSRRNRRIARACPREQQLALALVARQLRRAGELGARLLAAPEPLEHVPAHRRQQVVAPQ